MSRTQLRGLSARSETEESAEDRSLLSSPPVPAGLSSLLAKGPLQLSGRRYHGWAVWWLGLAPNRRGIAQIGSEVVYYYSRNVHFITSRCVSRHPD